MAARRFRELIALVRDAEQALIRRAGQTAVADRVTTLRGIYYGTSWSRDYRVEHSSLRNSGFYLYTGGVYPVDPRPALGASLFNDLQASQSVVDPRGKFDVGHALIGLDARNRLSPRTVPIPTQGGTGLEIVTWLGDLGGGAGNLAVQRLTHPTRSVEVVFHNRHSDYGAVDNLEGDAGGYLLASGAAAGGAPGFLSGETVAAALARYLPTSNDREWSTRGARLAVALGGTISGGALSGAASLVNRLTLQIADFAGWYITTRYIASGQIARTRIPILCQLLAGAAREVATVFVQILARSVKSPGALEAVGPYPRPSPPSPCTSSILRSASTDVPGTLGQGYDELRKSFQELLR